MTIHASPTASTIRETNQPGEPVLPDFRIGVLLVAMMSAATGMIASETGLIMLTGFAFALAACLGLGRRMLPILIGYLVLLGVRWLCLLGAGLPVLPWLGIMLTLMIRAFSCYVMMWIIFTRIPMGQMMASLARLRLPGTFLVAVIVILRYLPTLIGEVRTIWSLSRLRHTTPAWRRWAIHPIRETENLLVPVLMRSGRIADELSAVAVCKGLDPATPRSERIHPHIGIGEMVMVCLTAAAIIAVKAVLG